jgi:DNA polymerase-3 subunit delta'
MSVMACVFEGIIGHQKQCEYLSNILKSGNIAHAFCFAGSRGLGKATIAKQFSANILGLDVNNLHQSLNISVVSNDEDKTISVEKIRDLRSALSLSTIGGGSKIAIIDNADTMTIAAQNSLLKTLEEPSRDTVIILIAHKSENLLETIRSRVAIIRFYQLPIIQIQQELQSRLNLSLEKSLFLAQLSMGRPGFALSCVSDEICKQREQNALETLGFLLSPLHERIAFVEKLTKVKESREQRIQDVIELCEMWLHFALINIVGAQDHPHASELAKKYSPNSLINALSALEHCKSAISRNVSPALSLAVFTSSF